MSFKPNIIKLNKQFNNEFVYLATSDIPNAGIGAFAKKNIPAGTRLGEYKGIRLSKAEADALPDFARMYLFEVRLGKNQSEFIDGYPLKSSNWLRFMNGAITQDDFTYKWNVRFYQWRKKIWAKSIKYIPQNTELIADYGTEYWE